ncbi:YheC/D like ATP-grasp [Marininema mesophilum]|uniref:YheC/D like ATP-grasp n=1 Tax=Marininema mesophilum TaxID=1048340 RepID=A0A1H2YNU8_9BACL|nr:YheC/YheD family protein [Marininema mesophilum]SDX06750.1 YheC/D like ATP-grasp [Marininema mesophilum]
MAKILGSHPEIAKYTPITRLFNRPTLVQMVQRFPMIYLKPSAGFESRGILRVTAKKIGYEICDIYENQTHAPSFPSLYQTLLPIVKEKKYIIQQGIHSDDDNGAHFDIRVQLFYIQGKWTIGGVVARVASLDGIIAAFPDEGATLPLPRFIHQHLSCYRPAIPIMQEIKNVALKATTIVAKDIPNRKSMAVDLGLDRDKKIWILEVNHVVPSFFHFKLVDKKYYHRLRALKKSAYQST